MVPQSIEGLLDGCPQASAGHQPPKDTGGGTLNVSMLSHRMKPDSQSVLRLQNEEPLDHLPDVPPRAARMQGLLVARHQLPLEPLGEQLHVDDLADVPELDRSRVALASLECAGQHSPSAQSLLLHRRPLGVVMGARERARLGRLSLLLQEDCVLDHLRHALVREPVVGRLLEGTASSEAAAGKGGGVGQLAAAVLPSLFLNRLRHLYSRI